MGGLLRRGEGWPFGLFLMSICGFDGSFACAVGLRERIGGSRGVDLVITGEGRLDEQTLNGKGRCGYVIPGGGCKVMVVLAVAETMTIPIMVVIHMSLLK